MCSVIYNLYMCVLSLLNWNVAILLFIEYDANKIKTIKCHLCHVCAQLFISYVCMCAVIYKLCMYVIYWMWCKRNKDIHNVSVIFNSQA
jgi:tellurite resistance protein TehA-like permease